MAVKINILPKRKYITKNILRNIVVQHLHFVLWFVWLGLLSCLKEKKKTQTTKNSKNNTNFVFCSNNSSTHFKRILFSQNVLDYCLNPLLPYCRSLSQVKLHTGITDLIPLIKLWVRNPTRLPGWERILNDL